MSQFYDLASLVVIPSGYKASTIYAQKPLTTDGQLSFSRASTATRVNASGALETVASNVPRLDYTNSSCPKILLEPQRSQRLTQSNNFSHADWAAFASGTGSSAPILTANYTTSPFGTNDAWRFQSTIGTSGYSLLQQSPFISGQHTASLWVKSNTSSNQSVYFRASTNTTPVTVTPTWTRISVTEPNGDYLTIGLRDLAGQSNVSIDISIYAGQLEDGAYPTSIIPSTTAAVTRVADAASKTGISSLIGQTEGTMFVEATLTHSAPNNEYLIQVSESGSNRFFIYREGTSNKLGCFAFLGSSTIYTQLTASAITGTVKAAFAYKSGSFAFYVNGVQVGTSSATFTTPPTMARLDIDANSSGENGYYTYSQALLFKTRLTNAQLAELTTL